MQNVINALLNTILVSIPENIFLVTMTLIFLRRFDMLDVRMWKHSLKWIMMPVIPVAIMINLFRYIIIIPKPINSLLSLGIMIGLIVYIVIKNSYDFKGKLILKNNNIYVHKFYYCRTNRNVICSNFTLIIA